MLCLTRKDFETIHFPTLGIVITFLPNKNKLCARVGIDAPREIPIVRGELLGDFAADAIADNLTKEAHECLLPAKKKNSRSTT